MLIDRRLFLGSAAAAAAGVGQSARAKFARSPAWSTFPKKPVALAMWDFSWILRHHRYGEFEDWGRILDELADRGYNAVRLDVMPQYVAADTDGRVTEEFHSLRPNWKPPMWGNLYSTRFRPREALLEFIPACRARGIKLVLSTWFYNHDTGPRAIFTEPNGLVRAWTETLRFMAINDLLRDVLYVDLLNEIPLWHGFDALHDKLALRDGNRRARIGNPDAWVSSAARAFPDRLSRTQVIALKSFVGDTMSRLRTSFPGLPFTFSVNSQVPLNEVFVETFDVIDSHMWMTDAGGLVANDQITERDQSRDLRPANLSFHKTWRERRPELVRWMDRRIANLGAEARRLNVPCGNTEGWGAVFWADHPELDWTMVKEAGEICVDLARKQSNYRFICTSNFTHPQFKGIWEDLAWHRRLTSRIRA